MVTARAGWTAGRNSDGASVVWPNRAQALERLSKVADAKTTHTARQSVEPGCRTSVYSSGGRGHGRAGPLWRKGESKEAAKLLKRAIVFAHVKQVVELAKPAEALLTEIENGIRGGE